MEWGGAEDATAAARWLCGRLGVTPEALGWRDEQAEVEALAAEIGRTLVQDDDGTVYDQDTGEVFERPATNGVARGGKPIELETINAATLAGQDVPEQLWLVDNLIPHANVTLLSGDGATGKSLLALQLGVATATAGDWLGLKPHPGRVVFVSAEDELDELHRRLARMTPRLESLGCLTIVPLAGRDAVMAAPMGREGLLQPTPIFAALRRIVETHSPDLLVLDTLADLFGGDEIKKVHARQFISLLRGMAFEFGATVLLLSHPSQAGLNSGSGMSGNTAWNNSVRSRLYFERRINKFDGSEDDIDIRVLTTKKSNRAASGGKIVVRYSNGVFIRENGCNFETADRGHHADRVFMSLLAQFERDSRQVSDKPSSAFAPAIFAKHPKSEGLNKGDFEKAMNRLFETGRIKVEEIGPPSRRTRKIAPSDQPGEGEGDEDSDGGSNGHS
nr:AAA family ATPase [Methylosinus sp. KRF6]